MVSCASQRNPRRGGGPAAAAPARAPHAAKLAASPQQQHKAINRQITLAAEQGTLSTLLEEVRVHLPKMNGINLATAFHRVAKLASTGASGGELEHVRQHPVVQELFQTIIRHVLGHSLCSSSTGPPQTASDEMPVQCMSILNWSCATLQLRHKPLLMAIADITAKRLGELKPYELSNLLWAYAKLSVCPSDLFGNVATHILQRKDGEYKVQCLSTIAWAFATLKRRNMLVFSSVAEELAAHAGEMKPQEISNALWAFAKSRYANAELFQALGDAAASESKIWLFKPQELSNAVWAFATVGLQHEKLFAQVERVSMHKRHEMVPQNIANILWAFAKLEIHCRSTLFHSLLEVAAHKLHQHKSQEFSAIVWAAAQCCPGHSDFFDKAVAACAGRLQEFSPNALANLAKAISVVQMRAAHLFTKILQECTAQLSHFNASALCNLFRGATTAALNPSYSSQTQEIERAIGDFCEKLSLHMDELQPAELTDLVATLQMRRCLPGKSSLQEQMMLAKLQKQGPQLPKAAEPKTAHSVGSMSTTESQADDEDDGDHSDGASTPVNNQAMHAPELTSQPACACRISGGCTASDERPPPPGANDAPWHVPLPVPWQAPVSSGLLLEPARTTSASGALGEPRRVNLTGHAWEASSLYAPQRLDRSGVARTPCPTTVEPVTVISLRDHLAMPNPEYPAMVEVPAMRLPGHISRLPDANTEVAAGQPCHSKTLSEWFTERCQVGKPVSPSEAARIVRGVLLAAEPLLLRDAIALSCVQPDEIFIGADQEPRLREPIAGQSGGWGEALKWLSPEEASGRAGGVGAWAALSFRLGLLLHFLGAGSPGDLHPGKTGEAVLVGLLAELSGSGPLVRPDLAAYRGPDILRRLIAACLRLGGQAPPARAAMMAVLDALSSGA